MQICMNKIMQKYHLHHRLQPNRRQLLPILPRMLLVLLQHKVQHGLSLHEPFHQHFPGGQSHQRFREGDPRLPVKVPSESLQVVRLHPQIQLGEHNIPELIDAVLHAQIVQIEVGNVFQQGGQLVEDVKVQTDLFEDARMLHLDGDGRAGGVKSVSGTKVGFVHLGDAAGADGDGWRRRGGRRRRRRPRGIVFCHHDALLPLPVGNISLSFQTPPFLLCIVGILLVLLCLHTVETQHLSPVFAIGAY
mmetsp:Transcript_29964/g.63148  ORF Transcript_29964/g.63148 Transcript_29964/m.63148 type:complete len:247 (-) Transcript_29964:1429-2169(-)